MLAETRARCAVDTNITSLPDLVRCDSANLPFQSNSLDAIHAGAAMHCWPRVNLTLNEVYRVLKPGGVFYASTFFNYQNAPQSTFMFESIEQLTGLITDAGML